MEIINDINTLQDNISPLKNEPITNPNATIPLNDTQMTNGSHTMLQSQLRFICDKIEDEIKNQLPHTQITIHCEPFED